MAIRFCFAKNAHVRKSLHDCIVISFSLFLNCNGSARIALMGIRFCFAKNAHVRRSLHDCIVISFSLFLNCNGSARIALMAIRFCFAKNAHVRRSLHDCIVISFSLCMNMANARHTEIYLIQKNSRPNYVVAAVAFHILLRFFTLSLRTSLPVTSVLPRL